jgi:hypothetical protein
VCSFERLDHNLQDKVLAAVDRELRLDKHLLSQALRQQVALLVV